MKFKQAIVGLMLAGVTLFGHALEIKPYSSAALSEAQRAGKPVALHFHADWCPVCVEQEKVLQTLRTKSGLDVTVLVASYDKETELKRQHKIRGQSTLVVLRGAKETARVMGDTDAGKLSAALRSAL